MCENQDKTKEPEEVKLIHSQHARLLKEDDETTWISSEDLNTENSSEDDASKPKHTLKKKLRLKNRKRSSPNIRLQRPSISSIPSTSKPLDDRLLMPACDDLHSRSTDESRTSDEEIPGIPPISAGLTKRLSLEDWRPMKGALNISTREESPPTAGDSRKIVNETENFYNEMLYKLKSLKSCSVLKADRKEKLDAKQEFPLVEKTLKILKNTPAFKQKLDFINKFDEKINETIRRYKVEREERLNIEFMLCKNISEGKVGNERETERFMQICNFNKNNDTLQNTLSSENEFAHGHDSEVSKTYINKDANEDKSENFKENGLKNFIKKNISAAKEGIMANFSLTDEEKTKIASLLQNIDDFDTDDIDSVLSPSSFDDKNNNSSDTNIYHYEDVLNQTLNAYSITEQEKNRIGEIDKELENFSKDCEVGRIKISASPVKDEEFWKQFVLNQSLKEIDDQLEILYKSYIKDEERLKEKIESNI